mmetsp:Transcript_39721/g.95949  ORF Transcript_39721/g.95949 Transcript_39721/m.95949 type:complete len:567 (+) Transcript_39721:75-1775(+)|eukprot:CAMPEP_0113628808 /NCGR_PEP_ID=MMETSP0017_2-20120614/14934_1 /TAXON_ID=2856 /ORGANISM="Cylindrotheca closterium" /LENGTH=566 /DNA_ID=CAMNT_0000539141 /DNA_START=33 /DNA_END=1733 /DNA_ORIENTATION=+ /assembly_acc=CAM_ASM_000147
MNQGPNQHQGYQQQRQHHRNERESLSETIQQSSVEHSTTQHYRPPAVTQCSFLGSSSSSPSMMSSSTTPSRPCHIDRGHRPLTPQPKPIAYVTNPSDGSILLDHNNKPVTVDKILATKPLKHELSTRPGPGNKRLTYISGDGISRTLNDIFGFDGWNLDIVKVERVETLQNQGKHTAIYTAHVRLTHKTSGTYKEDVGMGDSTDRSFATAVGHAIKASITDAMKRAARHFGDKLGNSLYESSFSFKNAPKTLKEALDRYDIERCNAKFGFPKDRKPQQPSTLSGPTANPTTTTVATANTATSNGSGQTRNSMGGENKNNTMNPKAIAANQYQAPPNQGNRVPLSNLSGNAKPMPAPQQQQQQQGNQVKANFPFTPMVNSNQKPNPGHQQARQSAPSVPKNAYQQQQPISGNTRQAAPNATSNNPPANANRYNNTTVIPPQSRKNTYNSANSNRAVQQEPTRNVQQTVSNLPIGPPPTSTDTLKNSNLFSYPSQTSQPTMPATNTNNPNTGSAPPSRRGRFSMNGQRPIQGAPLVTPTANSINKRPNDAVDQNNKRHCRPNNPYANF